MPCHNFLLHKHTFCLGNDKGCAELMYSYNKMSYCNACNENLSYPFLQYECSKYAFSVLIFF